MVRDQDANVPVFKFSYDGLNIFHGNRVDPGKGSSSRMNLGFTARARAISVLRRSPAEHDLPGFASESEQCIQLNSEAVEVRRIREVGQED